MVTLTRTPSLRICVIASCRIAKDILMTTKLEFENVISLGPLVASTRSDIAKDIVTRSLRTGLSCK
jgi:hypothetical protein